MSSVYSHDPVCPANGKHHAYKGGGPAGRASDGVTRIRSKKCRCGASKVNTRKPRPQP